MAAPSCVTRHAQLSACIEDAAAFGTAVPEPEHRARSAVQLWTHSSKGGTGAQSSEPMAGCGVFAPLKRKPHGIGRKSGFLERDWPPEIVLEDAQRGPSI